MRVRARVRFNLGARCDLAVELYLADHLDLAHLVRVRGWGWGWGSGSG